jgi:hypothetical protein
MCRHRRASVRKSLLGKLRSSYDPAMLFSKTSSTTVAFET